MNEDSVVPTWHSEVCVTGPLVHHGGWGFGGRRSVPLTHSTIEENQTYTLAYTATLFINEDSITELLQK